MKKLLISFLRKLGYRLVKIDNISQAEVESVKQKGRDIIQKISPGYIVLNGPFEGLKYPHIEFSEAALLPKIVGSYEAQLHAIVGRVIASNYSDIIDVGCAEGYYAVGLAKSIPAATVHAYDINEKDLAFCRDMAALNGVTNITFNRYCSPETLIHFKPAGKMLVFCDAEGFELELFTSEVVKSLKDADFLIEIHDVINPRISSILLQRLSETHSVEIVNNRQVDYSAFFGRLDALSEEEKRFSVLEHRGGYYQNCFMEWFYCKAKGA